MSNWLNHVEASHKLKISISDFFNAVKSGFIEGLELAPNKYVFNADQIDAMRRRMIVEKYRSGFPAQG